MNHAILIDTLHPVDWQQVKRIYEEGIRTGNATFQTEAPDWETWNHARTPSCRLVARKNDEVFGFAALSPVSNRDVYRGVAEVSLYVSEAGRGQYIGHTLLQSLITESEKHGFWTLQAGIFPENTPSLHLHFKNGFREVGRRERVGKMGGLWRDTILLERRSDNVGLH
ncbi:phosphinothricin acetyltransferase [Salsuginibacillus halophilus]|uniref:Phosphinothricin acetyltransferase n=1 Tax=Salsuginibacillus halophilus TaxID=517424 RepID=A0A2P8HW42_9BACI|nr:GNAT family N-acetyltransferase [Salsuginibacillus halophilus]PSL50440.1 phosphinothricin acetyltransferase [Salsuginibacillus halophilus]